MPLESRLHFHLEWSLNLQLSFVLCQCIGRSAQERPASAPHPHSSRGGAGRTFGGIGWEGEVCESEHNDRDRALRLQQISDAVWISWTPLSA